MRFAELSSLTKTVKIMFLTFGFFKKSKKGIEDKAHRDRRGREEIGRTGRMLDMMSLGEWGKR